MGDIVKKLIALKPEIIDASKCTQHTSLYEQIQKRSEVTLKRQETQFNLGCGLLLSDPIKAADYLLEREYGDSFLFDQSIHKPFFIPPVFQSKQFTKRQSILDYDVQNKIRGTLDNLLEHCPDDWFTGELERFLQTQPCSEHLVNEINSREFNDWILNTKVTYLVTKELNTEQLTLPSQTTSDNKYFIQGCINELKAKQSVNSTLQTSLQKCYSKLPKKNGKNMVKVEINKLIESNPIEDSNIKWLWELQLSNLGESIEHWFFEELLNMDDNTLDDIVLLQSAKFMTNVENKKHREYDFLLLSYSRKLVVGIELKRSSTDQALDKACTQLEKYRESLEKLLGDQFGNGSQFFPAVCVETGSHSFQSHHYISMTVDLKHWLSNVLRGFPVISSKTILSDSLKQLKRVLRIIVFTVHVAVPITNTNWINYITEAIETVSTTENVIFYSHNQLPVFKSTSPQFNKLIIWGGYSTGKSLLLREKAMQLCHQSPLKFKGHTMYIHLNTGYRNLQASQMEYLLEPLGIIVKSKSWMPSIGISKYQDFGDKEKEDLLELVKKNDIKAIFFDEWEFGEQLFQEILPMIEICWVAPDINEFIRYVQSSGKEFEHLKNDFTFLDLSLNLRNSKHIVETSLGYNTDEKAYFHQGLIMSPQNFPSGCKTMFVDSLEKAIKTARKLTNDGILVVGLSSCQDERTKSFMDSTGHKWQDHSYLLPKQDNAYKLLTEGYIIFACVGDVTGFEWPVVICSPWENAVGSWERIDHHCRNVFMRCTTCLIVVGKPC